MNKIEKITNKKPSIKLNWRNVKNWKYTRHPYPEIKFTNPQKVKSLNV
jgi:hypothetical protein